MNKILVIAPLPPPINGQSIATEVLLSSLSRDEFILVNTSKVQTNNSIASLLWRVLGVLKIFLNVLINVKNKDVIYFHISESYYGNLKDLVIYTICSFNLKRIVIHLHGGSIGKKLFEKNPIIYSLNKFFLSRVKTIILTGPSHSDIFSSFISQEKIKYVYNFAQDEFFLTPQGVTVKFSREQELNLLFLSTISEMKGYGVL